jgi:hypothetical protein
MGSCWMVVGWGWGSGGLPFPDPLYYYQVDFHSCAHYGWGETNEQKQEYRGPAGGLGTGNGVSTLPRTALQLSGAFSFL